MRLDQVLVERGLVETRSKARGLILAGKVRVNGEVESKAGKNIPDDAQVSVVEAMPFVSRGGLKLNAALEHFGMPTVCACDPSKAVALDVGSSTGGFTDCLLQRGFQKVYAVDVGYGQMDWKLRNDPRVVLHERVNIRKMPADLLPEKVDLIVIDVSFISILKFLDHLKIFLKPGGRILAMVKPQFEGEPREVGKGGVIRDENIIRQIVERFKSGALKMGFEITGEFASPVHGAKGNQEVFCLIRGA